MAEELLVDGVPVITVEQHRAAVADRVMERDDALAALAAFKETSARQIALLQEQLKVLQGDRERLQQQVDELKR